MINILTTASVAEVTVMFFKHLDFWFMH